MSTQKAYLNLQRWETKSRQTTALSPVALTAAQENIVYWYDRATIDIGIIDAAVIAGEPYAISVNSDCQRLYTSITNMKDRLVVTP